jgi:hypothetical protein
MDKTLLYSLVTAAISTLILEIRLAWGLKPTLIRTFIMTFTLTYLAAFFFPVIT